MKPAGPINDSLISGMTPQDPSLQRPSPDSVPTIPSADTDTNVNPAFQPPSAPEPVGYAQSSAFASSTTPLRETPIYNQPVQEFENLPQNPAFSNPAPSLTDTNLPQQADVSPTQQATPAVFPQNVQTTSPLDTPPAPPSHMPSTQPPVNLGSAIVEEKPKRKVPIFLILLLFLVVIVLGIVGFLAFQNYTLNKNLNKNTTQTPLSTPTAAIVNPYEGYILFKSNVLPLEFMVPSTWKVTETDEKDLANQKIINADSSNFAYLESTIASGFEFRVGPVNDLTKKYDSFDAFSAEENVQNQYSVKIVNGTSWLIKDNEGKTLINNSPVTIALYSNTTETTEAAEYFNKILNSFKISAIAPTTQSASQSGTPL